MALSNVQKQRSNSITTLQKNTKNDRITDSLNSYGDLIWALASDLTDSSEDAEKVVRELFLDICRDTKRDGSNNFDEIIFTSIVARRHFIERSSKNTPII